MKRQFKPTIGPVEFIDRIIKPWFSARQGKQSLKIDGAVALSFACVAALQSGRPLDPEELRKSTGGQSRGGL